LVKETMKVLVSNIGSTSFKFRLFDMAGLEREIAVGGADRIGGKGGVLKLQIGGGAVTKQARDFADHGSAIVFVLEQLVAGGALSVAQPPSAGEGKGKTQPGAGVPQQQIHTDLDAVAFKAVMAGDVDAVCRVDEKFLSRMEYFVPIAPAHNPPYIAAMRMFQKVLDGTPLVAAMETGFHRTVPDRRRLYAVPTQWAKEYGVKRYGFHGASHRYIATRTAELMGEERRAKGETAKSETAKTPPSAHTGADRLGGATRRIISCHLGGSSSLCAIRDGASVAVSMGLSPQSGLPQSNRAGEFDPFAFSLLARQAGLDTQSVLKALSSQSGLAALSETSGDIRDILEGIAKGCPKARLTLELFVTAVRDYIGAYLVELGGADAIVFTGGIGQHNPEVRTGICKGLEFAGIKLDESKNAAADGNAETRIEAADSKTALWVMPTNEELIVARQTVELLEQQH
jgi:acetate kinase